MAGWSPILSPYDMAWALGKIERELELIRRGQERTFSAEFDEKHRLDITVKLTPVVKSRRIEGE